MISLERGGFLFPCGETGTRAGTQYFVASFEDYQLFALVIESVGRADFVDHIIRQSTEPDSSFFEGGPYELAQETPGVRTQTMRFFQQRFDELFLTRVIDNFQLYLRDLIREILSERPEILSDRKITLTLGEILCFGSIDSLISGQLDQKITDLSYWGFQKLRDWCQKKGIEIKIPPDQEEEIAELIATRNIIVHNRGLVDERYLSVVSESPFAIGELRPLQYKDLKTAISLFAEIVEATDRLAAHKFNIPVSDILDKLPAQISPGATDETL